MSDFKNRNSAFMDFAIEHARLAFENDEVPVGAVIVRDEKVISSAHNQVRTLCDPTAHAEILSIREACKKLNSCYLDDCELFVTLEPCAMCAKAILLSRIKKIYFGAYSFKTGAIFHNQNMLQYDDFLNMKVVGGFRETSCSDLLKMFFEAKRRPNLL